MNYSSGMRSVQEGRPSASTSPVGSAEVGEPVFAPEGRDGAPQGSTSFSPSQPFAASTPEPGDESLWQRLFPSDSDPGVQRDGAIGAGCVLGHFSIEERIGSGGMGAVFRAVDLPLQRVVALKVLSPAHSRDRAAVMRFHNEARAAARLDHDNIARVFYVGQGHGLHFIAFEYITGQNIRDLIARSGPLSVADALNHTLQITSALRHIAAAGVVHRDIKPSNIVITPGGRAKLVDLGLARKLTAETDGELTLAGTTLGTFDYISPEQARDPRSVDVRSDIYSLGCTLYHMLTGVPPYASGTLTQKLLDHQAGHVPDPRKANPRIPAALASICRKMMAGEPRWRYASPDDLLRDLATLAAKMGLRPAPPDAYVWKRPHASAASRIRPGFIWFASALVVLALAIFVDLWPLWLGSTEVPGAGQHSRAIGDPRPHPEPARTDRPQPLPEEVAQTTITEAAGSSFPLDQGEDAAVEKGIEPAEANTPAPAGKALGGNSAALEPIYPPFPDRSFPLWAGATFYQRPAFKLPPPPLDGRKALRELVDAFSWLQPLWNSQLAIGGPDEAPAPAAGESGQPAAPFLVRSADGAVAGRADSLVEAIGLAGDGHTILLQFNGPLTGGPIRQSIRIEDKEITLAAGEDEQGEPYRPVIEFANNQAETAAARKIVLSGPSAALTIEGLRLRMSITNAAQASDAAVFFLLDGPARVTLRDVAITIDGGRWPCSVFELRPADNPSESGMNLRDTGQSEPATLSISDSFLRGSADLVTIAHSHGARIEIRNSGIVLQQSLINMTGGSEAPEMGEHVDLSLEHATVALENPLLRVDLSGTTQFQAPIEVTASDNVLATFESGQLIFMNGADGTSFDGSFLWDGTGNIFYGYSEFWSVSRPADGAGLGFPSSFEDWQQYWQAHGSGSSLNEQGIAAGDESRQLWADRAITTWEPIEFTPADLRLNHYAMRIEIQASDASSLIGANPATLPEPVTGDQGAAEQTEQASLTGS